MREFLKILPWTILGFLFLTGAAQADLEGTYETIGPIPEKNSLDVVIMEEFLNFTCPHCNNFRNVSKPLLSKYGKRLKLKNLPIAFRGQPDTPIRLYFIAEKMGRSAEIKEMIFDTTFVYGQNIFDPKVVSYLARSAGLAEEFRREFDSEWVNLKIREARLRADQVGVRATPTIVLNGAVRLVPKTSMNAFVGNLDRIVSQLLKKEG